VRPIASAGRRIGRSFPTNLAHGCAADVIFAAKNRGGTAASVRSRLSEKHSFSANRAAKPRSVRGQLSEKLSSGHARLFAEKLSSGFARLFAEKLSSGYARLFAEKLSSGYARLFAEKLRFSGCGSKILRAMPVYLRKSSAFPTAAQ